MGKNLTFIGKAVVLVFLQFYAAAIENGIDKGSTSCYKKRQSVELKVEKGDFGYVVSHQYPGNYTVNNYHGYSCHVEIRACLTCRIRLQLLEVDFPDCPAHRKTRHRNLCLPGCDHLQIHDADSPYVTVSKRNYHSQDENSEYLSISSSIIIRHCMSNGSSDLGKKFRVKYEVIEKREMRTGMVSSSPFSVNGGYITSPNFPDRYALNGETFTYTIQNLDPYGHIRLVFDDWHIASSSQIQIYDGLDTPSPTKVFTRTQRPAIVSESSTLLVVFNTGRVKNRCCQHIGFKATYQFVSEKRWMNKPNTNCSAMISAKTGGKLELSHSFGNLPDVYDCIWIIKRPAHKNPDGMLLRLVDVIMGEGWLELGVNSLEIYDGITSLGKRLVHFTSTNLTPGHSWMSGKEGFYIRLRGILKVKDRFSFVYTAVDNITDDGCPKKIDYMCKNLWCIDKDLVCDGVDNCGDNSDESPDHLCSISKFSKIKWPTAKKVLAPTTRAPCPRGHYRCHRDWTCIAESNICDRVIDCKDKSDEMYCPYYRREQRRLSTVNSSCSISSYIRNYTITILLTFLQIYSSGSVL